MLHRRDAMMRLGQLGLGAVGLPTLLAAREAPLRPRRARSVILLYLWGGPPQQDLWDMKPDAPAGIRSELRPIQTAVPGMHLCDQLPRLARHTDKLALVRSVTHASTVHEPSVYYTLTGKQNNTLVVPRNQRRRSDFPNFGSFLSALLPAGPMPTTVTVPRPVGHDGVNYAGTYAGWLGPRHDPFEIRDYTTGRDRSVNPLELSADLDATRLAARRGLLQLLEEQDRSLQNRRFADGLSGYQEQALRMLVTPHARRAFNLDHEAPALRDRYGRNEYGDSFLLARRLIEAEVRLVSVIWMYITPSGAISNVWDTHGGVGALGNVSGFQMLRAHYCCPPLDRAYAALLEDLSERGLLDETLVVAMGEFGRTPRINNTGGREHWGPCGTAVFAGGGVRGGQIYGRSDAIAAYPADNPVSPEDVLATIYHALGIDPQHEINDREGRPIRLCEGTPITALF